MFRICWELLTFWRLILVDLMQPCLNTGKYTILWVWLHEFKIRAYHWLMISATKKYLTSLPWLLWIKYIWSCWDFPGGSDSKESACSVGDQVWSLGKKQVPWRNECYAIQCSCLENSVKRGACQDTVHGVAESDMNWSMHTFISLQFRTVLFEYAICKRYKVCEKSAF